MQVWENPVAPALRERDSTPEEARESGPVEVRELDYPHPAACRIPTKVTATQLKGRELDEEIAQGTVRRVRQVQVETPRFLIGERPLSAAQRGTAMHLLMQYLDLSGPGAGAAGAGPAGPASADAGAGGVPGAGAGAPVPGPRPWRSASAGRGRCTGSTGSPCCCQRRCMIRRRSRRMS